MTTIGRYPNTVEPRGSLRDQLFDIGADRETVRLLVNLFHAVAVAITSSRADRAVADAVVSLIRPAAVGLPSRDDPVGAVRASALVRPAPLSTAKIPPTSTVED